MSNYVSYFLGILTVLIILIIFWFLSISIPAFNEAYKNSVCYKI
jgi:hypothetical protein